MQETSRSADVIVVGAGPGGSTTAAYLASHGLDVVLLEKSAFPRDKICGDGLTPRAVRELLHLGFPIPDSWPRHKGLRIVGGGNTFELDWPEVASFPPYGLVCPRESFDHQLAQFAVARGADLHERTSVADPIRDDATGAITGVTARELDERGRATGATRTYHAPVVVAADGVSSRIALAMGRAQREDRPMGVAVRTYYPSERRSHDDYLESWLELWVPEDPTADPATLRDPATKRILLPGYGWLFGCGDGTVNVGLGMLNTSPAFGEVDYRDVLRRWVAAMPGEGFDDATMLRPIRGAALPMAFNRQPLYADRLLLVGDAGGMVNPFNGEGIDYAMESGRKAAEIIAQALGRGDEAGRERVLTSYNTVLKDEIGGYFTLGRTFATLIGHPEIMRLAVKYGLPRRRLMKVLLKVMANLGEEHGGRLDDRVLALATRLVPSA